MDLTNTTALVTGACSGLGAATAQLLAKRGSHVIGVDLPKAVSSASVVPDITLVGADVTDPDQVRAAVDRAAQSDHPFRVVVNCAGIAPSARIVGRAGPHDPDLFRRVVEVNLIGTFTVLSLAAAAMAEREPDESGQRGVIVNTASIAAFEGQIGQAAYAASKGGIASLTLPAARDLASLGIRVCAIAPGIMDTQMLAGITDEFRERLAEGVPFPHRLGRPEEFAALVASIIEQDYLNGEIIRLDGALRMTPR